MAPIHQTRRFPFSNPLANALVAVVGVLAVGASLVLGFLAFVTLGVLLLVLASVIGIRVWWFNRRFRGRGGAAGKTEGAPPKQSADVKIIEGEYRVVSTQSRPDSTRQP